MLYDLHIHTKASDGTYSSQEIIDMAVELKLPGIAITDHDTVEGLVDAADYLTEVQPGLEFVPGIEINTEWGESEIHILGYFIDYSNRVLNEKLSAIKEARYFRAVNMVEKLKHLGMPILFERVEKLAKGDLIGRPHVAQALLEAGYVLSLKEAFQKYLGLNCQAYVPRYRISPLEAIQLIKLSGGLAVLAHPGLIKEQNKISSVLAMGIQGMEVFYPEHNVWQTKHYYGMCCNSNLLITGGSDFHGCFEKNQPRKLGCNGINQILYDKIKNYHLSN